MFKFSADSFDELLLFDEISEQLAKIAEIAQNIVTNKRFFDIFLFNIVLPIAL